MEREFTGIWLPPDVFNYIEEGKLSPPELTLLAVVEATASVDEGCILKNEELAALTNRTPNHVSHMISKLVSLKLLRSVHGEFRQLFTSWSNPFV